MTGVDRPRVGYVGVDVLNNATICNEAAGLLRRGVPLEVVSVHRHDRPTFYRDESLETLRRSIYDLSPMTFGRVAAALVLAPLLFGFRFWATVAKAVFGPAEGLRQRLTIVYQLVPAAILARHWRSRNVGHIHAHWAHTATAVAMHAAGFLGVGFSFTGHANDLFVHRVGLRAKVRRARFIVCISEYHRRFYLAMGAAPARLPVVYCGIDMDRFREGSSETPGRPRVVAVGRLVEKKGFGDLIAASALLRDRGFDFDCTIAGSGPELAKLRAIVADHGLGSIVEVTGSAVLQEDLPALLGSASAFALPCVKDREGDMDGLPQVLIEALACGVPVISTRLVGIPDLVRDGEDGRLVDPGDVRGLADAMAELLSDPERASAMGRSGSAWAREHFSLDETADRLSAMFAEAAGTPGDAPLTIVPGPAPGSEARYEPKAVEMAL